jgi:U3 small nucleolar RNA-associated protein 11
MLSRKGPDTALSAGTKRWDGTVAGDRGNKALPMEVVRLLKTQDMGYIRSVRNVAMKEVRSLEERVIALGGDVRDLQADEDDEEDEDDFDFNDFPRKKGSGVRNKNKKIVFAEGQDEREEIIQQRLHPTITTTAESSQTHKSKNDHSHDDNDDDGSDGDGDGKEDPETLRAEQKQRLLEKLKRRLQNARKKRDVLAKAEHELEMQRARMAKTATVGGVTKAGKKFKIRERKR